MAVDRLAARRAAQQQENPGYNYPTQASGNGGQTRRPNPYAQQDDRPYEMSEVRTQATPGDPQAFYTEISSLVEDIRTFNKNVNEIGKLHYQSVNNIDASGAKESESKLERLVQETSKLSSSLKIRIQNLEADPGAPRQQTSHVKSKFKEAIQQYMTVERDYREKYRERVERQYKIVNPDASAEQVHKALQDLDGGQVFSQALLSNQSNAAYKEVRERHQDVQRIERTLEELAQLFNDMSVLVSQQQETIEVIETQAATVEHDTEAGLKHTHDAVKSAKAARKKRWICFFIIILILAIIAAVVGGYFANQNKKKQQ